jgi:hypothetical protein
MEGLGSGILIIEGATAAFVADSWYEVPSSIENFSYFCVCYIKDL